MGKSSNNISNPTKKTQSTSENESTMKNDSSKNDKSKSSKTLDSLFEKNLKDIYSAEKQLIEALPEMAKLADSEDLQDAITNHLQQTKRQAERLEKIFDRLGINKNEAEKSAIMEELITEGKKITEEYEQGSVRDSALIIAAQKVEHYEIAVYGSLRELAEVLGYPKIAEILDRTLMEEEDTDQNLSCIAQDVNDEACEFHYQEQMV